MKNLRKHKSDQKSLLQAIDKDDAAAVAMIIKKKGLLDADSFKLLRNAYRKGNVEIIKHLLNNGADPSQIGKFSNYSLIHLSAQDSNIEVLKLFLEQGDEVDIRDHLGNTPLHYASRISNPPNVEAMKLLIDNGADVASRNIYGNTPLHIVASYTRMMTENAQILLDNKAPIDAQNFFGYTPLHYAITTSHWDLIPFLIEKGADLNITNKYGENAYDIAILKGDNDILEIFKNTKGKPAKENLSLTYQTKDEYIKNIILPPKLDSIKEKLYKTIKPFASITLLSENKIKNSKAWSSKVGGNPYMPKDAKYPKDTNGDYMQFIAQINFSEIPQIVGFPRKGLIQFFIYKNYFEMYGETMKEHKVVYYKNIEEYGIIQDFSFLPKDFTSPIESGSEYFIKFEMGYAPMNYYDFRFGDKFPNIDIEDLYESSFEANRAFQFWGTKVGGYPFFTQVDPRSDKSSQNIKKTELLFQLGSTSEVSWGGSGVGNWFISPKSLEANDYSDVLFNWDCT